METQSETNHHTDPLQPFSKSEVRQAVRKLKLNKAPGYDLITAKVMKELPEVGITFLTQLFNAILRLEFIPEQWKTAEIILILKPGKEPLERNQKM